MIELEDKIDIEGMELVSAVHWAESSRIVLANNEIYSFSQRPYLIDPLSTKARLVCVRKARGLGFSETFILKAIHGLDNRIYPQGVQYIFPTETAMREFVQSRFNVVIKRNYCLKSIVKDTDTTYYKRVGEGNLFLNGGGLTQSIEGQQKESMAFRSKQIDHADVDELDNFEEANDVIERVLTSMMNSDIRSVTAISNPTISNFGIDKLFQMSNQMYWHRQCKSCGELTCPDLEFPRLIDREGCHCRVCGGLLDYRGTWKPEKPERNDLYGVDSTDWEGYHLSCLNHPRVSPYSILVKSRDLSVDNQEKLHKFYLGLPYDGKANALTLSEVYDCCGLYYEYDRFTGPAAMGVDVGSSSGCHVIIGYRTGKDSYEIIRFEKLEKFEDVIMIGRRFGVQNCVCDMRPEVFAARKFQKEAGFRVWLHNYQVTNPVDEVVWDEDRKAVKSYRNSILDRTFQLVVDRNIKLPKRNRRIEEFAKQYIAPVKREDPQKPGTFKYVSKSDDDHYRHSMNYFILAAQTSRLIRKETYKKESRKAKHETVKI